MPIHMLIGAFWGNLMSPIPPTTLGYRLFMSPIPLDRYWLLLLVPLTTAICVVYKTIKVDHLSQLPRQAALLTLQILVLMILAAVVLGAISYDA